MGDDDGALQDLESLLLLVPHNKRYRSQHAIISRRRGHWDRAFADYITARGLCTSTTLAAVCKSSAIVGNIPERTGIDNFNTKIARQISQDSRVCLSDFRVTVNQMTDIHDALFLTPSRVQVALATDPALRSPIELQQLSDMLSTLKVFQGISPHCMAQLAASVSYRPLKLRDTALTCNAETDACFIVLSGRVSMRLRSRNGTHAIIDHLLAGDIFGDSILLASTSSVDVAHKDVCYQQQTNAALSETYQAEAPSELLVIPRQVFDATLRNIAYQNLQRRFSFLRR